MVTIIYKQCEWGYKQQRDGKWDKWGWLCGSGHRAAEPDMVSLQLGQFEGCACPSWTSLRAVLAHLPWRPLQTALLCTCSWWEPCQWLCPGNTPRCRRGEETQSHQSVLRHLPAISSLGFLPISNKDLLPAPHICSSKAMESPDGLCWLSWTEAQCPSSGNSPWITPFGSPTLDLPHWIPLLCFYCSTRTLLPFLSFCWLKFGTEVQA